MRCDAVIAVLGKPYTVIYDEPSNMGSAMGSTSRPLQAIKIDKTMARQQQEDTLLHEVLHLISKELSLDLSEETVCRLAVGLHSAGCRVREGKLELEEA